MSSRARLGARRKTRSGAPSDLAGGEHRRFNAHDADVQNALAGDFRNVYAEFVAMLSAVRVLVYEGDFDLFRGVGGEGREIFLWCRRTGSRDATTSSGVMIDSDLLFIGLLDEDVWLFTWSALVDAAAVF